MKKIDILREEILIDEENKNLLYEYSWFKDTQGYVNTKLKNGKHIKLHQLIMGKKDNFIIDHKNGNKLDNRKENLQFVTYSYNLFNKPKKSDSNQKYKGIQMLKNGKYRARTSNGKQIGKVVNTPEEAYNIFINYSEEKLGGVLYNA